VPTNIVLVQLCLNCLCFQYVLFENPLLATDCNDWTLLLPLNSWYIWLCSDCLRGSLVGFGQHIGWVFAILFASVVFTLHSNFYAMWKLLQFCWSLCFEFEPYPYVCSKFMLILEAEFKTAFIYFLWKLYHQFLFFVIILWCGAFMLDSSVVWTISSMSKSFFLL